ncbi:MAG: MerR family transcriptional regulator [Clostridia bacterium]|nr:MerR family transcriptional regulator [Clostridia bacterium]
MELRNCPECGKIFAFVGINLCPKCKEEDEKEFIKVKEYLYKNPNVGIFELAEATEVDEAKIVRWVREGRIEGKYPGMVVSCERCGKSIFEGRFCPSCSNELARSFSGSLNINTTKKPELSKTSEKAKFHIKSIRDI